MKILIGYDGGKAADAVLKDLERAGLPAEAEVRILIAVPPVLPAEALTIDPTGASWQAAYISLGDDKERIEAARERGQKAAYALKKPFPEWDVRVEVPPTAPAQALLEFAETWSPDLIAVGSHGWSWLGRALLGSTAEKVMAHAQATVRLCHPRRDAAASAPRILVAVDGSFDSRLAVEEVMARNWPAGTRVLLVAAKESFPWVDIMMASNSKNIPVRPAAPGGWIWMEGYLSGTATALRKRGLEVETALLEGDPRHVLLTQAEAFRADCIFMGRRGLTAFNRLLLGSVSGSVASHAPCSVEIIRKHSGKGA